MIISYINNILGYKKYVKMNSSNIIKNYVKMNISNTIPPTTAKITEQLEEMTSIAGTTTPLLEPGTVILFQVTPETYQTYLNNTGIIINHIDNDSYNIQIKKKGGKKSEEETFSRNTLFVIDNTQSLIKQKNQTLQLIIELEMILRFKQLQTIDKKIWFQIPSLGVL